MKMRNSWGQPTWENGHFCCRQERDSGACILVFIINVLNRNIKCKLKKLDPKYDMQSY